MTSILNIIKNNLLLFFLFFLSCAPQSEFYSFYHGGYFDQDVDLMLRTVDSTYIYNNTIYPNSKDNIRYKEIGHWKTKGDTIILTPKVEINDDSSSVYNPLETFYSASEMKNIPIRYYVKKENYIIDCTFNYYYPNDSCTLYFWYPDPLFKRKIKQNKEEKNLIYSRKTIDRIW